MSLIRKHVAVLQAWACLDLVLDCHLWETPTSADNRDVNTLYEIVPFCGDV